MKSTEIIAKSAMSVASRRQQIETFSAELLAATDTLSPVRPLRDRLDAMTLEDAYAVQEAQLNVHLQRGRKLAGRKVGLTSLAMQQQLGVDSPDFGFFFDDMVYGQGARIPASSFIQPKVEPEFGFVLKTSLSGPGVTRELAVAAIDAVYPAIEIIDSRIRDWDIKLVDTVADNASCGAIAVGHEPLDVSVEDLSAVTCDLLINNELRESGKGEAVMGDPVAPLVWLANVLGEQGVSLESGQLILPGSFTRALPVVAGETATASFGDLGALSINFI